MPPISEDAAAVAGAIHTHSNDILYGMQLSTWELSGSIGGLADGLVNAWLQSTSDLTVSLGSGFDRLVEPTSTGVGGLWRLLGGDVAPAGSWGPQIAQLYWPTVEHWGFVGKKLRDILEGEPGDWLDLFWKSFISASRPTLEEIFGTASPELKGVGASTHDWGKTTGIELLDSLGWIFKRVLGPVAQGVVETAGKLAPTIAAPFLEGMKPAFNDILSDLTSRPGPSPAELLDVVKALFDKAAGYGIQAHMMSALAGMDVLGVGFDFGPVAAFLGDIAAYGRIVDPYIDAMTTALIGQPARYLANITKRPYIPMVMDLNAMYWKMIISEDDYKKYMAWQGYSAEWIARFQNHIFREPGYFELKTMVASLAVNPAWTFHKLQRAGFTDSDAAIFTDSLSKLPSQKQLDKLLAETINIRRDGLIDEDEFGRRLPALQINPETAGIVQDVANVSRTRTMVKEVIALVKDCFDRDFLDLESFAFILQSLGVDEFKWRSVVMSAAIKRYRRITWQRPEEQEAAFNREVRSTVPKYLQAYASGDMTTSDLETLLVTAGLIPEVADLVLMQAKENRLREYDREMKALGIPDKRDLYTLGLLSEADYRKYLTQKLVPPGLVEMEVAISKAKRDRAITGKVRRDILPTYEAAFVQGWIAWDELERAYDLSGIDVRAKTIRTGLVEAKRRTKETGAMQNDDVLAWVRAAADYVVTEEDFTNEMEFQDVVLPLRQVANALVPVLRNIDRHVEPTEADFVTLFAAMTIRLISNNDVLTSWITEFNKRKQFARWLISQKKPRTGLLYGEMPATPTEPVIVEAE